VDDHEGTVGFAEKGVISGCWTWYTYTGVVDSSLILDWRLWLEEWKGKQYVLVALRLENGHDGVAQLLALHMGRRQHSKLCSATSAKAGKDERTEAGRR